MFLWIAVAMFGIFVANVLMGALANAAYLTDVGEMIVLFLASVAFTVAILRREMAARRHATNHDSEGGTHGP